MEGSPRIVETSSSVRQQDMRFCSIDEINQIQMKGQRANPRGMPQKTNGKMPDFIDIGIRFS
jgi:hypothetical protein